MRYLVLYVFHLYTDNVERFIRKGLIRDPNKTFIFICNNLNLNPDLSKWKFLDDYENAHLLIRKNIGLDFQAWNQALFLPFSSLEDKIIRTEESDPNGIHILYDRFVCINSTVAGPYVPDYVKDNWIECFTHQLSDIVKICGISVNYNTWKNSGCSRIIEKHHGFKRDDETHIQSMAFALDREGFDILLKYRFFHPGKFFPGDKNELILGYEVGMSVILRHEGKSIASLMKIDGVVPCDKKGTHDDLWYSNFSVPLYETIFVKANRGLKFPEQAIYDNN